MIVLESEHPVRSRCFCWVMFVSNTPFFLLSCQACLEDSGRPLCGVALVCSLSVGAQVFVVGLERGRGEENFA